MKLLEIVTLCMLTLAAPAKERAGERHDVAIESLKYAPTTLTIRAGDTVIWTNNDDRDHTVVAKDGSFKSGNIGAGQTYEHTFTKPGKYAYACSYHPRMTATIIVTAD